MSQAQTNYLLAAGAKLSLAFELTYSPEVRRLVKQSMALIGSALKSEHAPVPLSKSPHLSNRQEPESQNAGIKTGIKRL